MSDSKWRAVNRSRCPPPTFLYIVIRLSDDRLKLKSARMALRASTWGNEMVESKKTALGPNEQFIGREGGCAHLNTPALLLDLDALERNIAAMATHAKSVG